MNLLAPSCFSVLALVGSHNPDETTTLDAISDLVEVESKLTQDELVRANELYGKKESNLGER